MMYKINNTQKILLAIGVGVGVAYVYNRYKKNKKQEGVAVKPSPVNTIPVNTSPVPTTKNLAIEDMSRAEKEEFIIDNVSSTAQQDSSGFEGTRFVWNPTIEKMYPVGTIQVGKEPSYMNLGFSGADGVKNTMTSQKSTSRTISPVLQAENSLKDLTDQEIDLLASLVNTMNNNPSIMSEEQAIDEMGITNQNLIKLIKSKFKKRLNDIKIMKKSESWESNWRERKKNRSKDRKEFFDKMGFDKSKLDQLVAQRCGGTTNKAEQKKCVEKCANYLRSQIKNKFDDKLASASVSEKDSINSLRQKSFTEQLTNRSAGGIYGGYRWDGESNADIENLVDKGLI
jgi:hypothetical protein